MTRKDFLKKACLSGACMCGIAPLLMSADGKGQTRQQDQTKKNPNDLQQEWIAVFLSEADNFLTEEEQRTILKKCAMAHYNAMGMSDITEPYKGRLNDFISCLINDWGWQIDYNESEGVIIANENKNHCICPMVNREKVNNPGKICLCSEGFIEKMFSDVTGKPVKSRVITSVLRGDQYCRYRVTLV